VPYTRTPLFASPLLEWQHLRAQEPARRDWSDEYHAASARLLVPLSAAFLARLRGATFACDAGSALWLTPERGYRLQPAALPVPQEMLLIALAGAGEADAQPLNLDAAAHARLARLAAAWRAGRLDAVAVEEALVGELDAVLGLGAASSTAAATPHAPVERTRALLAAAPERSLTLAAIGREVGCSPFHLARRFRARTGRSIHRYREELRAARALVRLQRGERDLTALALELGYSSHSHFSAAFRDVHGASPSAMRTILTAPRRATRHS
jgi:AraC-like DNA-binding protein